MSIVLLRMYILFNEKKCSQQNSIISLSIWMEKKQNSYSQILIPYEDVYFK